MLTTNGSRLYYPDSIGDSYVCYCMLKHSIQIVTSSREVADYYILHGFMRTREMYKIRSSHEEYKPRNPNLPTWKIYKEWFDRVKLRFGQDVYVY